NFAGLSVRRAWRVPSLGFRREGVDATGHQRAFGFRARGVDRLPRRLDRGVIARLRGELDQLAREPRIGDRLRAFGQLRRTTRERCELAREIGIARRLEV